MTTSTLLPSRPSTRPDQAQDEAQRSPQTSLDKPRNPSPRPTTGTAVVPQGLRSAGPPIPRPRQPRARIPQRPVSARLLPAPRSFPLVTVNSPTFPHTGHKYASPQPLFQPATANPLRDVSTSPQSPRIVPVPPKRVQPHTMATPPQLSVDKSGNGNMDSQPISNSMDDDLVTSTIGRRPPLVSRAEKPKIPTKPISVAAKVNLEPFVPAIDERISPFSTPPSSDETIEQEPDDFDRDRALRVEARGTRKNRIALQPTFPSRHSIHHPTEKLLDHNIHGSDARRLGFAQDTTLQRSMAISPPRLPPRRVQDQQRSDAVHREQTKAARSIGTKIIPRHITAQSHHTLTSPPSFLPPPKSSYIAQDEKLHPPLSIDYDNKVTSYSTTDIPEHQESEMANYVPAALDYPEVTSSNRRHPYLKNNIHEIDTNFDTRLLEICGHYVCTTGHLTKIWDSTTGELVLVLSHGEKEIRVTALAFKPGVNAREEGCRLWLGTSHGDIQELDIATQSTIHTRSGVHDRREIIKIYRHQGSMWTLDDGGKLCVWLADETGLLELQRNPIAHRVPKGHTFSIVIQDTLWMATGKELRIFRPNVSVTAAFWLTQDPLIQPGVGSVTSGAVIGGQLDRVYFGHADGKVTIYSTTHFGCIGIVSVSVYKISSLAGAGFHLWAGYNTGTLFVYDTRTQPWATKKEWLAHSGPILDISVDRSSLWKDGVLRVVSLGADNAMRFWDGILEDDWLGG